MKRIYIGADHAGFILKERIKKWFDQKGISYVDVGNIVFDPKDDYPDFAISLAQKVVREKTKGILCCGSAEGMCIAANKVNGARAVNPSSLKLVKLSREHNDANILCLSGWFDDFSKSKAVINLFLRTPFSGSLRHKRRLAKIKKIERGL